MPKPKKTKQKRRRGARLLPRRVVIDATLGILQESTATFLQGVWYTLTPFGFSVAVASPTKSDTVFDTDVDEVIGMWEEDHPGQRWAYCVSAVETHLGRLRRRAKR